MKEALLLLAVASCGRVAEAAPQSSEWEDKLLLTLPPNEALGDGDVSPDLSAAAFALGTRQGYYLLTREGRGKTWDKIRTPRFSPDGKTIAYTAYIGKPTLTSFSIDKEYAVVGDRVIGEEYDSTMNLAFSPDGKTFAYVARKDNREFLVADGRKGEPYASIERPVFSPDGTRVACVAVRNHPRKLVVVDGREQGEYAAVSDLQFTPDGKGVAFVTWEERDPPEGRSEKVKRFFFVVGGRRGEDCEYVTGLRLRPDGEPVYIASVGGRMEYGGYQGGRWFVVSREEKGEEFDEVRDLLATPDGRIAYAARTGAAWRVVTGDEKSGEFDDLPHDRPDRMYAFQPKGTAVAYAAVRGGQYLLVAGKMIWKKEGVLTVFPQFSPDGRKVRFVAFDPKKRELWRKVMDVE